MASAVMDSHFEQERIKALREMGAPTDVVEAQVKTMQTEVAADFDARRAEQIEKIRAGSPA